MEYITSLPRLVVTTVYTLCCSPGKIGLLAPAIYWPRSHHPGSYRHPAIPMRTRQAVPRFRRCLQPPQNAAGACGIGPPVPPHRPGATAAVGPQRAALGGVLCEQLQLGLVLGLGVGLITAT